MTGWLPRIRVMGWTGCDDDGVAEGFCVSAEWLGCYFELAIARREK